MRQNRFVGKCRVEGNKRVHNIYLNTAKTLESLSFLEEEGDRGAVEADSGITSSWPDSPSNW